MMFGSVNAFIILPLLGIIAGNERRSSVFVFINKMNLHEEK